MQKAAVVVVVGVVVIIVVVTIYVSSSNKTKVQLCITQLNYNTNKYRSVCLAVAGIPL